MTKIYSRDEVQRGKKYRGPAIITEYSATAVIPEHRSFMIDKAGNLIVRMA